MSFRCSPCRLAGILLAALFVPGLAAAAGSCERLVATGNPEYPPYLWRDPQDPKRLIGANADLLQRLGKELGVRIDVLYSGSWEKAQEEVTSGRADLLAGAYLTLARLGSMDYVHPPFLMTSGVVWVNKDAAFPFIGRDDLIGHKGSVLAGSSLGEEFDRFAKASLDLKPVPSLTQGAQAQRVPPLPGVARAGPGRGAGHGRRPGGAGTGAEQRGAVPDAVAQLRLQRSVAARTTGEKDDRIVGCRRSRNALAGQSRTLESPAIAGFRRQFDYAGK